MLTVAALVALMLAILFQAVYVGLYARRMRIPASPSVVDSAPLPRTGVILCLRGCDPSLQACLRQLYQQEYPDFHVLLAFDSAEDPAALWVAAELKQHPDWAQRTTRVVLPAIANQGSLKCQAIAAAVAELPADRECVAFVDADCLVDRFWLQDLMAPFADERVGGTTGQRFFEVSDGRLGSQLREVWNSAAIVQMMLYQIAWGGSLAVRRQLLETTDLLERWRTAFCEDTMLQGFLQNHQLQLARVPELVVVNRESITLGSAYRWIVRQLLTSKLYSDRWPLVVGHALMVGSVVVLPLVAAGKTGLAGEWTQFAMVFGMWLFFQLCNAGLWLWVTELNRRVLAWRAERVDARVESEPTGRLGQIPWRAIAVSQIVQPLAVLQTQFTRTIRWRGIRYRLAPKGRVDVEAYHVYRGSSSELTCPDSVD